MTAPSDTLSARLIYLNGELMAPADAQVSVADRGVLFGLGFFETFRTSGGRPHLWRLHRRRLEQACATTGLVVPRTFLVSDDERLADVVHSLLRRSGFTDAVFRYTVTAGAADGPPTEFLTLRPLPAAADETGICLRVLTLARDNGEWLPRPKSLNYANALLGACELARRSSCPDDEGLFLSRGDGFVVETARQNVAWIRGDCIYYPDPSVGALAGVGLAWCLERDARFQPRRAGLDDLLGADAVLVCNSVRGITAVREIRDQQDRVVRESLASNGHPVVGALRRQWDEDLKATAQR